MGGWGEAIGSGGRTKRKKKPELFGPAYNETRRPWGERGSKSIAGPAFMAHRRKGGNGTPRNEFECEELCGYQNPAGKKPAKILSWKCTVREVQGTGDL